MIEEWRFVVGFEGQYEVSNLGRVRSLDRVKECNHWDHYSRSMIRELRRFSGRMLRPGMSKDGHLSVAIGKGNSRLVHALVLESFIGPCPPRHECCHADDNPSRNHLNNLRWGTRTDNLLDAVRNGKKPVGEHQYNAKLKASDIPTIKAALKIGSRGTIARLAREYGVNEITIRQIKNGLTWKHVGDKL